jgi:DNA invertase Pin-like site-specific DNA recombinase
MFGNGPGAQRPRRASVSLTDGCDSSTAAGRMIVGVLGSLAEDEHKLTRELKRAAFRTSDDHADASTSANMRLTDLRL